MRAVLTSLRLSWSAAGDITGGSSSSSWVGCREQSIVSSVMQLEMRMQKAVELLRLKNTVILLLLAVLTLHTQYADKDRNATHLEKLLPHDTLEAWFFSLL